MDVYEAVMKRRSVRRFKDKPVPYEVLEKCVDAGRLAPCGHNHQILEYIIVDDEKLLSRVFDCINMWAGQPKAKSAPPPQDAPRAYIVILINTTLEAETGAPRVAQMPAVGMSAENMILVAQEQGIGTCPIMGFEESELKQVLNVPESYDVPMLVLLGYPDESPVVEVSTGSVERWVDSQGVRHVPKRKLEDILHRNGFA